MGNIFFAFSGYQEPQFEAKKSLGEGYEIWNLTKMTFTEFVEKIKAKIPPINSNVTEQNYLEGMTWKRNMPELYKDCRWGILMPTPGDRNWGFDDESLFCINLFSPEFLYPLFRVEDLGITAEPIRNEKFFSIRGLQEKWELFDEDFVAFHKMLLPGLPLTQWVLDRVSSWSVEDYRVWNSCMLFDELKRFHNSKRGWLSGIEYMEHGIILETLFTLSSEKTEITYRLKKRVAVLLEHLFPTIEKDVHELYKRRSNYVHGTTFEEIQRAGENYSRLIDFPFSEKSTKHLRFALTAYLYLHASGFSASERMGKLVDILENAVLDSDLRSRLIAKADEILNLMPQ